MKNLLPILLIAFSASASELVPAASSGNTCCPLAQNGAYTLEKFLVSVNYPNVNIFRLNEKKERLDEFPSTSYENVVSAFLTRASLVVVMSRNNGTATTLAGINFENDFTCQIQGVNPDSVSLSSDGRSVQYAIRPKPKRVVTMQLGHGSQSDE